MNGKCRVGMADLDQDCTLNNHIFRRNVDSKLDKRYASLLAVRSE